MILLSNWQTEKDRVSEAKQLQIINLLIIQTIQDRAKNPRIFSYKKDKTYWENKWYIEYKEKECNCIEFSFNCLKLGIFQNNKNPENYKFFRYLDLFYKHLKNYNLYYDKKHWIASIKEHAEYSDDNNSQIFVNNIDQYIEKEKLIQEIERLYDR